MYKEFALQSIDTSLNEKAIKVYVNKDIDVNNTNDLSIEVFERKTKTPLITDYSIEKNVLCIKLRDWPIPNTQYILGVKGLKSVIGEELSGNIKGRIEFPSTVTSKVIIVSPTNFEKIDTCKVELKELLVKEDDTPINNFYVEISTDNAFINVPYKISINEKNTVNVSINKNGQYFLRARVEKNNNDDIEYGEWSDIISFVYGNEKQEGGLPPITSIEDEEDSFDAPIVQIDDFELSETPEQGETPKSFLFEFTLDLEELINQDNIMIIRKDVK